MRRPVWSGTFRGRSQAIVLGLAIGLGVALRLFFVFRFPIVTPDGRLYLAIARTWSRFGVYGTDPETPSILRMPGYPAFLAAIGELSGSIEPRTVYLIQTALDLGTCVLVALLATAVFGKRTGNVALVLALLCPFTANYVSLVLTETLAIFATAAALLIGVVAMQRLGRRMPTSLLVALGAAIGAGILLRPDGAILLPTFALGFVATAGRTGFRRALGAAAIVCAVAFGFLVPWIVRNAVQFGEFQPLKPRVTVGPGERASPGVNRWVATWILDYVSDQDVWWKMVFSHEPVDPRKLPARAFGSPGDPGRTLALIAEFNEKLSIDETLDRKFGELASERIRRRPLVCLVLVPVGRMADMWLRPRTEMLPLESRWWEFQNPKHSWISIGYALLNLVLLALAAYGAAVNFRRPEVWFLVGFAILRTAALATVGNPCSPEERYTLECYPAVLALAASGILRFESLRTGQAIPFRLKG